MDIGVMHVTPYSKADPAVVARHAEDLGFESYWVGDHTVVPVDPGGNYPGARTEDRDPDIIWQLPDPFVALARAGATTSRIKLGTGVCLIPERNPLLTAKQVATLDDGSDGRFLFGVGAGWNEGESRILGGDFEHRWAQVKDHVAAMKVLWTEDVSEYHGRYVDFPPVRCFPKPAQRPHPPILIGSISNPKALQRVVDWGDGWIPVVQSVEEFAEGVNFIKGKAREAGRAPDSLTFTAFGIAGQWHDESQLKRFAEVGATRVVLWIDAAERDAILRELDEKARLIPR